MPRLFTTRPRVSRQTSRPITIHDDDEAGSECEIIKILPKSRTARPKPRQRNTANPPRATPRTQVRTTTVRRRTSQASVAASSRGTSAPRARGRPPITQRRRITPTATAQPRPPRRKRSPQHVDLTDLPSSSEEDSDDGGIALIDAETFQRAASLNNTPEVRRRFQPRSASDLRSRLPTPDTLTISDDEEDEHRGGRRDGSPYLRAKTSTPSSQPARSGTPWALELRRPVRATTEPPRAPLHGLLSPPLAPRDLKLEDAQLAAIKVLTNKSKAQPSSETALHRGEDDAPGPKTNSKLTTTPLIITPSPTPKKAPPVRAPAKVPVKPSEFTGDAAVKPLSQAVATHPCPVPASSLPRIEVKIEASSTVGIKQEVLEGGDTASDSEDDSEEDSEQDEDIPHNWNTSVEVLPPPPPPRASQFSRAMKPTIDRLKKRLADGQIALPPPKEILRITPMGQQAIRSEMQRRGISTLASYNAFLVDLMQEYSRLLARSPVPLLSMMTRSINDLQDECLELNANLHKMEAEKGRSLGRIVNRESGPFNLAEIFPESDSSSEESSDDLDDDSPNSTVLGSILAMKKKEGPGLESAKTKCETSRSKSKDDTRSSDGRHRASSKATTTKAMSDPKKRPETTSRALGELLDPPKPRSSLPSLEVAARPNFAGLLKKQSQLVNSSNTSSRSNPSGPLAAFLKRKQDDSNQDEFGRLKQKKARHLNIDQASPKESPNKQPPVPITEQVGVLMHGEMTTVKPGITSPRLGEPAELKAGEGRGKKGRRNGRQRRAKAWSRPGRS